MTTDMTTDPKDIFETALRAVLASPSKENRQAVALAARAFSAVAPRPNC